MVIRLVVRLFTKKPAHADIGHSLLNKLGVATHYLFYLLVDNTEIHDSACWQITHQTPSTYRFQ
jgi:cytochrome b561